MLDKIVGLRKLIVSVIILGVAIGVTYLKGDVPSGLVSVLGFIFAGFVVGNAVEHITDGSIEKATISATPQVPAASAEQVQVVETKLAEVSQRVAVVQQALTMIIQKYGIDK